MITAAVGLTLLVVGAALLVLPGPAFIVIAIGLAVLGTEFAWAKSLLSRAKEKIRGNAGSSEEDNGRKHG